MGFASGDVDYERSEEVIVHEVGEEGGLVGATDDG